MIWKLSLSLSLFKVLISFHKSRLIFRSYIASTKVEQTKMNFKHL